MSELAQKKCTPCQGGVPALPAEECKMLLKELHQDWELNDSSTRLTRTIKTDNFKQAFDDATKLAELAESQNHHPVLTVGFGFLKVEIWTHKIDALVESDFIYAAKADKILVS